jgi:O-antigen/teichoic acid export membrane protein
MAEPDRGRDATDAAHMDAQAGGPPILSSPWGATPPAPLGSAHAYQAVGEVASPLLAGFSVTLVGVIAQSPASVRWVGLSMLLLTLAAGLLLAAVQYGFHSRQMYWTRGDLLQWYVNLTPLSDSTFQGQHRDDLAAWRGYVGKTRRCYNLGIVALGLAVASILVPPSGRGDLTSDAALRWLAALGALLGVTLELYWWRKDNLGRSGR